MIRWFAGHPTAANLLMVAFLAVGIVSVPQLKRETFPDFAADQVQVQVLYPGASAEDVELAICQRLEDALDGITYLEELTCEAREGQGLAVAELEDGGDLDEFFSDIRTETEAIDSFPDTVEDPVIRRLNRTDRVVSVAITGPMAVPDLKEFAELVKNRLTRLPSISQVTLEGFSDRQIRVEPRQEVLRQYGLSVADIAAVIGRQSVDLPAGAIETRERDVLVRFNDERRRSEDFERLIVASGEGGAEVPLGALARITDRFELDEEKTFFNGRRAALLKITKTKTEDSLVVIDAVRTFLERERAMAPPGITFTLTEDVSSIVRDRLELLTSNGVQGLILVFLVMLLFFSFRYSFWVAMGLPVSFMGAFMVMVLLGLSINMITMVGLLIAIGVLMDDAIVLSESIATSVRDCGSVLEGVTEGVHKVGGGVMASFLTTVCVFGPLMALDGNIGKILQVLPVILLAVLAVSLVEAFLILPHHLKQSLQNQAQDRPSRVRRGFERGFTWFGNTVAGGVADAAVRWRYLTIGIALALLLVSVSMVAGGHLKFRAFPDLDGDVLEARILLPQGTPLSRTEDVVERVLTALQRTNAAFADRQPDGLDLVQNVMIRYGENTDAYESGAHLATVIADLLSAEVRDATIDEISTRWRWETGSVTDTIAVTYKEPALGPAGPAIEVELNGEDLNQLKDAALALRGFLGGFEGVVDLEDDLRPGKPELRLTLREGAYELGVDARTIAEQLRAAFHGVTADEIQAGTESFEIDVRLAPEDQNSLADLDTFMIMTATPTGNVEIPLTAVAYIETGRGFARINRIDGIRTVTVRGDVQGETNANEVMALVQAEFLDRALPERFPGVVWRLGGAQEEQAATQASMRRGFLLGLIGVFLLLSFQFRSYLEPIAVMLTIPMALIGVIWGHLLLGQDLSMPSIMGFISLSGVVVNNAILLVEFAKRGVGTGLAVTDALSQASRQRFRALVLTTATTVVGLMPILSETSLQAQILIPLVTSLAFGLMSSTLLVLFVVPAFYGILNDLGLARPHDAPQNRSAGSVPDPKASDAAAVPMPLSGS